MTWLLRGATASRGEVPLEVRLDWKIGGRNIYLFILLPTTLLVASLLIVLTNELVSRKDYYEQAIILAMVSFINQGVFYETLEGIKDHPVVKKLES